MVSGKTRVDLNKNEMLRLAVTRLMELIGEAAAQYPRELQEQYPQIPWSKLISMRNKLIHAYDFVDYDIVWGAINKTFRSFFQNLIKASLLECNDTRP